MDRYEQMESLQDALDAARAEGDTLAEASALFGIGQIYRKDKVFEAAGDFWRQCEAVCRKAGHQAQLVEVLILLGDLAAEQGRTEEAEKACLEALEVCKAHGLPQGRAKALDRLGDLALVMNRPESALDRYNEGLELCLAEDDRIGGLYFLDKIIPLSKARGDMLHVEQAYRRAVTLADKLGDRERMALGLVGLADVYQRGGRVSEAVPVLEMAHDRLLMVGKEREAALIRQELARLGRPTPEKGPEK